jgi:transposase InsO family protein
MAAPDPQLEPTQSTQQTLTEEEIEEERGRRLDQQIRLALIRKANEQKEAELAAIEGRHLPAPTPEVVLGDLLTPNTALSEQGRNQEAPPIAPNYGSDPLMPQWDKAATLRPLEMKGDSYSDAILYLYALKSRFAGYPPTSPILSRRLIYAFEGLPNGLQVRWLNEVRKRYEGDQNQASFEEFEQWLLAEYPDDAARDIATRARLATFEQRDTESVDHYVKAYERIEFNLAGTQDEGTQVANLLSSLRRDIKTAIYASGNIPRTRRELIDRARNIEVGLNLNNRNSPRRAREAATSAPTTAGSSADASTAPGPPLNRPLNDFERKRRRPHFCFGCGEDGHYKPDCKNPPNPTLVAQKRREQDTESLSIRPRVNFQRYHRRRSTTPPKPANMGPLVLESMEIDVRIRLNGKWVVLRALLDTGAEANIVRGETAQKLNLKGKGVTLPLEFANGAIGATQGQLDLLLKIADSSGRAEVDYHSFVIGEAPKGIDILLGIPWHAAARPQIDFTNRTWRHPITKAALTRDTLTRQPKRNRKDVAYVLCQKPATPDLLLPALEATATVNPIPLEYQDFTNVLSQHDAEDLPLAREVEHRIDLLEGAELPYGPLYPMSAFELEELRKYLDEAMRRGWIRPSRSSAGAPVIFVPKKDGRLRLCVDYRALNRITKKNRAALPLISEILDRLSTATLFTKLDLKDAYHRIRIRDGDQEKTAFRTKYGHFEYLVMPFGLTNAPATFQSYINECLRGLVDLTCIVYLDDILIYSQDPQDHVAHVRAVLARLQQCGLVVNLEKCAFHVKEIDFLGFIVSTAGIQMDPKRVQAIREWEEPNSIRGIRTFLGFTGYYRRFIQGYAKVSQPLSGLLRGATDGPITLSAEARQAFQQLRDAFKAAPVLIHYDPTLKIRVETDASAFAISAILSQQAEDRWHPVAFYSRQLRDAETRYETADAEFLAIVEAFRNWRHYLAYSTHTVQVRTDHLNHCYFETKKILKGRQVRWAQELSGFDFVIEHNPGVLNPADPLSRLPQFDVRGRLEQASRTLLPCMVQRFQTQNVAISGVGSQAPGIGGVLPTDSGTTACDVAAISQLKPVAGVMGCKPSIPRATAARVVRTGIAPLTDRSPWADTLLSLQQGDAFVVEEAWKSKRTSRSPAREAMWSMSCDGLLRFRDRIYVPPNEAIRRELLESYHDIASGGHLGVKRTLARISQGYYWDSMRRDVKAHVRTCAECQGAKARRHRPYGELGALPEPIEPWQEISLDFITDLPSAVGRNGKRVDSILVIVDRFTKYALYIATTKRLTAEGFADLFMNHIFRSFGLPQGIVSDRGSLFTSKFWDTLCALLAVKRRLSTAYHPQTDGQTERQNQTLENYLRIYCNAQQDDWPSKLLLAEWTYNSSIHTATKSTPFRLLYGYNPRGPADVRLAPLSGRAKSALDRIKQLQEDRVETKQLLQRAHESSSKYYNRTRKDIAFREGEWVLLNTKNLRQRRPCKKLSAKYIGPFKIVKAIGDKALAYQLDLPTSYRIHNVFPISSLEKFYPRPGEEAATSNQPEIEEDLSYNVEQILDHKGKGRNRQYLIRWEGYAPEEDSWEPRTNVAEGPLLREYEERHPVN